MLRLGFRYFLLLLSLGIIAACNDAIFAGKVGTRNSGSTGGPKGNEQGPFDPNDPPLANPEAPAKDPSLGSDEREGANNPRPGGDPTHNPPGNPNDPGNPGNPNDPENPGNPNDPENPGNPNDPENPGNPNDPENPGNPDDPSNPGGPTNPAIDIEADEEVVFQLSCDQSNQTKIYNAPKASRVHARVKGEFCPTSRAQLTVAFVVDFSGSMGRHFDPNPGIERPGNDVLTGGSCGRLQAAQAIIQKLKAEQADKADVRVAMIPFAGGILNSKLIRVLSIDAFQSHLTAETFCEYIAQDGRYGYHPANPGGIPAREVDSSTNYRAAFETAESMLRNEDGSKVVYFISDGQPTSGGADPVAAGEQAGRNLRDRVDNLTVNGLLLGDVPASAQQVLELVTGSASRVRKVARAVELADAILEFPEPSIRSRSGRAILSVAPYRDVELGLISMHADPSRPGIWVFETQPFVLLGRDDLTTDNVVTVQATGQDGSTHQSRLTIQYNWRD